ncbi:hypothetical protein NDU88_008292 [Pleurodeles waltl]|uniref:Uncharacterized protein n=1 Tax=Pleurodeles waltl TaxID=8319 RepID=A0AAV7RX85_PLEWA|nr:hypothetical protein NDU88_008292 [Pleurodeles waltl]
MRVRMKTSPRVGPSVPVRAQKRQRYATSFTSGVQHAMASLACLMRKDKSSETCGQWFAPLSKEAQKGVTGAVIHLEPCTSCFDVLQPAKKKKKKEQGLNTGTASGEANRTEDGLSSRTGVLSQAIKESILMTLGPLVTDNLNISLIAVILVLSG